MLHFSTVKTENHRNGIPPMVPPVGPLGWLRSGGLCPSSRTLPSASSGLLLNLPCAFPVQLPCASAPRLLFGTPVQLLPLCGSSHRAHPFMPRLVSLFMATALNSLSGELRISPSLHAFPVSFETRSSPSSLCLTLVFASVAACHGLSG